MLHRGKALQISFTKCAEHNSARRLFGLAVAWAKGQGAEKLYISGHSAVETQAFYQAMGCREAEECSQEHVSQEPFDCQLEYVLSM